MIEVEGEQFHLERNHGQVYLKHSEWSLMGVGRTLNDAIFDMRVEARLLWDVYGQTPINRMTRGALKLRGYIYKVMVADPTDEVGNCLCSQCRAQRTE